MAQKIVLIDDIDGTTIDDDNGGSFRFSLDGIDYVIDLTNDNYTKLQDTLELYNTNGKRLRDGATAPATRGGKKSDPKKLAAIREWAKENGHELSTRGRISGDIITAYETANPSA
jgi:hypothetical protein